MTLLQPTEAESREYPPIVETYLDKIGNIATLPAVAVKLMDLVDDPESDVNDIKKVIISDPALCSRILRVVNSSFYGFSREIGTIKHAVMLLGLNAVKNIAIAASLHKAFQVRNLGVDFDVRELWTHSVAVATAACSLADRAGLAIADEAFLAGLMHDIGVMVELQADRTKFAEVIRLVSSDQELSFRSAEEQVYGTTHEALGGGLYRRWRFPVHLELVAGNHHQPMQLPESCRKLGALVHTADILAARSGAGYARTIETQTIDPEVLGLLNLSEHDINTVAEILPKAVDEALQLFAGPDS